MSVWTLYWLTRLPAIKEYLDMPFWLGTAHVIGLIILGFLSVASFVNKMDGSDEDAKFFLGTLRHSSKWFAAPVVAITILFETSSVFVPDNKDMAIILGGAYVTNQEDIAKLPANVAKTLNTYLEQLNSSLEGKTDGK